MVDVEKLISLVHDREPLWDITNRSYHNRYVARILWREVAAELSSTCEIVKAKWQNLRDNFRREYAKISKRPTGSDGDTQKPPWRFYDQLLFLSDAVSPRSIKTNISPLGSSPAEPADESTNTVDPDEDVSNETETLEFTDEVAQRNPLPSTSAKSFKRPILSPQTNAIVTTLLSLEQRKLQHLERLQQCKDDVMKDEDYYFLMSLLPHLREIPKRRKLATRIKIQEILMAEQEAEPSTTIFKSNAES